MPRFCTVASEVNTINRLIKPSELEKTHMITHVIISDSGSKKWTYLRHQLKRLTHSDIQRFAAETTVRFAIRIARIEFLK